MLFLNGKFVKYASFQDLIDNQILEFTLNDFSNVLAPNEFFCYKGYYILSFEESISAILLGKTSELTVVKRKRNLGEHISRNLSELDKNKTLSLTESSLYSKYTAYRLGYRFDFMDGADYRDVSDYSDQLLRDIEKTTDLLYK